MEMLQQLKDRYDQYSAELQKVIANKKPMDGLLGMGEDPRRDPCHMRFYEDVEVWVRNFLASEPDEAAALEAAWWIIAAPAAHREQEEFWFEYAAHGLCRDLVPRISPAGCAALRDYYDENYPRRDRMPVQKELYRLLKNRGSKK